MTKEMIQNTQKAAKAIVFALFLAAMTVSGAKAEDDKMLCNDRSKVLEHLAQNYSEAPTALGVAENGGVIEVLTSNDGDSWTILLTTPAGLSCLVAMGNTWEQVQKIATGPRA